MATNTHTQSALAPKNTSTHKEKSVPAAFANRPEVPSDGLRDDSVGEDIMIPDAEAGDASLPELIFTPEQCLFCNSVSLDFDANISHMQKKHGLFIPVDFDDGFLKLAVDLETLVRYLHLVVFGYNECLYCHSQKQTTQAVQQHMMGKGHCRIDLNGEESEFKDFYEEVEDDSAASENDLVEEETLSRSDPEETGENPSDQTSRRQPHFKVDGKSLSLSSGKVLSHRSVPPPRQHRPLAETQRLSRRHASQTLPTTSSSTSGTTHSSTEPTGDDVSPAATPESSRALTRFERRAEASNRSPLSLALSKLSVNDRTALAHLPASQQRAIVLTQFKQQGKARQHERR
ncbi:Cytoplasmic 60S subunit biogenesis factor REI1 [Cytospora mali]|uniref:Cytoplasmic 60S subunit biogenesis factor REI1 n=1 Tax=Cytospora mali TaxID=578113 RepID=A0A194VQP5_CYTMA|nr:Cytoplasmic 60S subunit biogenesis factor REI1 [Valsa mali]